MDNITIHKGVHWFPAEYIADIKLDNSVVIHLRSDGSALGDDGRTYFAITEDDENGDCLVLGYSADINKTVVKQKVAFR